MAGITLDTGALIAADRGDDRFWTFWKAAGDTLKTVPAPVVAQAWRGARNARMSRMLDGCLIEPFDEELARDVGELCGRSGVADVVDVMVVLGASRRGDIIISSDPEDMRRIAGSISGVRRIIDVARL